MFWKIYICKKNKLIARFITIESHDKRYVQFPKTARIQEKKDLKLKFMREGNVLIYLNCYIIIKYILMDLMILKKQ